MPRPAFVRRVRRSGPRLRIVGPVWALVALCACAGGEGGEETVAGDLETPGGRTTAVDATVPEDADPRLLTGLYIWLADAPAFTPCGAVDLVTDIVGAAADSLDRAYRVVRPTPGDAVLVSVLGRLAPSPADPGGRSHPGSSHATETGDRSTGVRLVVDSVVAVEDGGTCPDQLAAPPLEGTAWQLVGLPDPDPALGAAGTWMRLEDDGSVSGYTGCRELTGRYTWTGARLNFSALDTQVAMCGAADVHDRFLGALASTGSYRYRAGGLDLLDEHGVVARFEGA